MPLKTALTGLPERMRRHPWAIDLVLGTVVVVIGVVSTGSTDTGDAGVSYERRDAAAWALILASTLPYYVRRREPLLVVLVTVTAVAALMIADYNEGALPIVLLGGAYTVGAYRPFGTTIVAACWTAVLLVLILVSDSPGFGGGGFGASVLAFGAAFSVGWTMQTRRQRIDAFEREQQEVARRAAADERLRIAQEMHDVVGHSLGVIAIQAGVAAHVMDSDPDEARRSLDNISRTSRSSLAEIRRLLGMLRNPDGTPAYTPAPTSADVRRLISEVADAGLPVDLDVNGDPGIVPAGVSLAAYRIVQESLTNALRHAGASRAEVKVDIEPGLLRLEITDDGKGPNGAKPGGHGLVGMRERVAMSPTSEGRSSCLRGAPGS